MNARLTAASTAIAALLALPAPADAVDWAGVGGREVLMFQPGQSAWEWLVVPARHDGARRMREGRDCLYCHEGEERVIAAAIGSGQRLEPDPMPGMPHIVELDVRIARVADTLHLRLSWPATVAEQRAGPAAVPTRVTVMFGSDAIPATAIAGCWISCHTDLPAMADAQPGTKLTKYLPNSRVRMTATGGGDTRGAAELAAEREQGRILDYLQVELDGGKVLRAFDGYILDARREYDETGVGAQARIEGGRWTVEISRPLAPAGGRIALTPGRRYTLGFALHENHADGRHHYVSFPLSMVLDGGEAEIVVRKR